jgi:nucleotide-binding universal stress UspA family protein
MKILCPVDGSKFTKKALAFLVTHETLCGPDDELVVLHVQPAVSPRVRAAVGADMVASWHKEESEKVLGPVRRFLDRHDLKWRGEWKVGGTADEILKAATREKAQMIVMGTHGHGMLGRVILGSVAQRVVTGSEVPVLLVK